MVVVEESLLNNVDTPQFGYTPEIDPLTQRIMELQRFDQLFGKGAMAFEVQDKEGQSVHYSIQESSISSSSFQTARDYVELTIQEIRTTQYR